MIRRLPPVVVRDPRADDESHRRADTEHRAHDARRRWHPLRRELVADDRKREREYRKSDPLNGSEQKERRQTPRKSVADDAHGVQNHRDEEEPPFSVRVSELS